MARKDSARLAMSRKQRNALLAGLLLIVLPLAVVLDRQFMRPVRQAVRHAVWADDDYTRYHEKVFTVVRVVDGDTLDIGVPDGNRATTRIRLLGVDTPETHPPSQESMFFGPEAAAFVRRCVEGKQVKVVLDTVADHRDRYGRLLAVVVLPGGEVLNEQIIRQGYGYADLRFEHSRYEAYIMLMESAIGEKSGLWKDVRREQLPSWLRQKRPDLLR